MHVLTRELTTGCLGSRRMSSFLQQGFSGAHSAIAAPPTTRAARMMMPVLVVWPLAKGAAAEDGAFIADALELVLEVLLMLLLEAFGDGGLLLVGEAGLPIFSPPAVTVT